MPKDENPTVKCECGYTVRSRCLDAHQQSDKHKRYLETREQGVPPKTGHERRAEVYQRYFEANREKIAERMKTYREHHQEKLLEQSRTCKAGNKDKKHEQSKSYQSRKDNLRVRLRRGAKRPEQAPANPKAYAARGAEGKG